MRVPVEFEDNKLWISEEAWLDLTKGENAFSLSTVRSTVVFTLERGGAFIISKADGSIMRRFDRPSEFATFMNEINDRRREAGLQTLEP